MRTMNSIAKPVLRLYCVTTISCLQLIAIWQFKQVEIFVVLSTKYSVLPFTSYTTQAWVSRLYTVGLLTHVLYKQTAKHVLWLSRVSPWRWPCRWTQCEIFMGQSFVTLLKLVWRWCLERIMRIKHYCTKQIKDNFEQLQLDQFSGLYILSRSMSWRVRSLVFLSDAFVASVKRVYGRQLEGLAPFVSSTVFNS